MTDLFPGLLTYQDTDPSRVLLKLSPADLDRLTWWADRKGVPLADILHEAVAAYLGSVRAVHRAVEAHAETPPC